jgi:hypothetical protein
LSRLLIVPAGDVNAVINYCSSSPNRCSNPEASGGCAALRAVPNSDDA